MSQNAQNLRPYPVAVRFQLLVGFPALDRTKVVVD